MNPMVDLANIATMSEVVSTSGRTFDLTALAIALGLTAAAMVGDIWSRRTVTVVDAVIIGAFFTLLGACTPVGQVLRFVFGAWLIG